MNFGQFTVKLNTYPLIELFNTKGKRSPTEKYPWMTLSFRTPSVALPFQTKNELGEWQRMLEISAPTILKWININDISWEFHLRILGFGITFSSQYGY